MWNENFANRDALSATLMNIRLQAFVSGALDAGGNWAVEFPVYEVVRFNVVLQGECWLAVEGERKKYHLRTGDCFLLTSPKSFVLAKDLSQKRRFRADALFATAKNGVAVCNGGGDFFVIGAIFEFEGHMPKIIFGGLPAVIHIPENLDAAAVLRWSLERFRVEFRSQNLGRSLMINHLAPIMLLQTFRIYLESTKKERNWLTALSDPKLSKVIAAMHAHYKRHWSLEELAKVAGLSRAGLALNFKRQVGLAPIDYLTHWRMQIACGLLRAGENKIADVASAVGYESESAFSVAFKKIVKCRPGSFRSTRKEPMTAT